MSHFYERVINKNLSYSEEISKIKTLFFGEKHVSTRHYYQTVSASTLIDGVYFRKLPVSANYIHLSDMWSDLINGDEPDTFVISLKNKTSPHMNSEAFSLLIIDNIL